MHDNDKEILLYRILSGLTYFSLHGNQYVLRCSTKEMKHDACVLYNSIINEEKYQDWIREENIIGIMTSLGLWSPEVDKQILGFEKKIEGLKVELFEVHMMKSKHKGIRSQLKGIRALLSKIFSLKGDFISNSLEGYASSIKNEFLICRTLYQDDQPVFNYDNRTSNNLSYSLFNELVHEIDKMVITTEQFKELARSPVWKSYWNLNNYGTLLNHQLSDWTDEQRALVNLSKMYDNIHEHPECPNDIVLADDDMLDGWMIVQRKNNEKNKKLHDLHDNNAHLKNAGEVVMFANNDIEREEIMSLNTKEGRRDIQEKLAVVASSTGPVEDQDLPDVKRGIQKQIQELKKTRG